MIGEFINLFKRNKLKKLVALILATALWFFVMGSQNPVIEGSYNVPVSVANVPRAYRAVFDAQDVAVKLSAPRSYFVDYSASDIRAFANMANFVEGDYTVSVEAAFPKGFELVSITPNVIKVKLDPYIEKQMDAEIIMNGSPMENAEVVGLVKSSNSITVLGPKTLVDTVKRVIGYVGLSGNGETFDLQVPLTPIDSDGRTVQGVRAVPSVITVTVEIENGLKSKVVPVEADVSPPSGKHFTNLSVNPANVKIVGTEDAVNDIDFLKTAAVIIPPSQKNFKGSLKILLPEGVTSDIKEVEVTATTN